MPAATKEKMIGSEKSEQEHVRHLLHKTCNQEVSGRFSSCSRAKQWQRNVQKKCAALAKLFFAN